MRILYAALDQTVPGSLGGSVHVQSVAEGLAALGHEVHAAVTPGPPKGGRHDSQASGPPKGGHYDSQAWCPASAGPTAVTWHAMSPPAGIAALRWLRRGAVTNLARRVNADTIMERYYNFGGEGVLSARALGLPAVLEVNAPVVDYPGSAKAAIDRALLVQPMRRWRDRICRATDLFVTPRASILPAWVDRARVLEVEWGADTDRFHPKTAQVAGGRSQVAGLPALDPSRIWCVFAGAFRAWHGAARLAAALAALHRRGDARFGGLFIGDGPERAAAARAAEGVPSIIFTGAIPHADLPAHLAAADIGVAPFEVERHPPLQLGFFWSPLKVFEYMASGLPVVAPRLPRLQSLIAHGQEGLLYDADVPGALEAALTELADAGRRKALGAAARARAVRDFSWKAHCEALDKRLRSLS
jgi:glycosyltransferase involved in cell wall biosynthesis